MTGNGKGESGKVVRDRIPRIIREDGAEPVTTSWARVLGVVHALAADLGAHAGQPEKIREVKASQRGGFADRIVWTGNR
ncbi:hypothetical protein ACFY8K_31020 [Streptomyces misionensis]|uniref:hypothetical protein n=1 Tax=Streptomyces misionensis TaxID=67331 RepID=UPI0036CBFF64